MAECERVEGIRIDPRDLPGADTPDPALMPVYARAHCLLQRCAEHRHDVRLTYKELGLEKETLRALLGPIYDALFINEHGETRAVPECIPRKVTCIIGTALAKLASRFSRGVTAGENTLADTDGVFERAAARKSPY